MNGRGKSLIGHLLPVEMVSYRMARFSNLTDCRNVIYRILLPIP